MGSTDNAPTRLEDYDSAMVELNKLIADLQAERSTTASGSPTRMSSASGSESPRGETQNKWQEKHRRRIPNIQRYCQIVGISDAALNSLNVIHVIGTKGKGNVCAFCESVLRHRGYKTGFYSSPHLIETRERIRLNGIPLSRETFTRYFWPLYDSLVLRKPLVRFESPLST